MPSISSSGNISPASTTRRASSYSTTVMFLPMAPSPPRGITLSVRLRHGLWFEPPRVHDVHTARAPSCQQDRARQRLYRMFSRPTTSPCSARTRLTASSTPGMNDSRERESCRMVSVSPRPPKMTSWWATSPGDARCGWGPPSHARLTPGLFDPQAGEPDVPEGASSLRFVVELDDLAGAEVLRPPARRTASSAPRPWRNWEPRARRTPWLDASSSIAARSAGGQPGGAHHHRRPVRAGRSGCCPAQRPGR